MGSGYLVVMAEPLERFRVAMAGKSDQPAATAAFEMIRASISCAAAASTVRPEPHDLVLGLALASAAGRRRLTRRLMGGLADLFATPGMTVAERFQIATGVSAVGALAIRLDDWKVARALSLLPSGARDSQWEQPYLISAARLDAARDKILAKPGRPDVPLIEFARDEVIEFAPNLSPDLPAEDERVLDSLCYFNALASLVQSAESGDQAIFPEFLRFEAHRTDDLFRQLVGDLKLRSQVLAGVSDARLAQLLISVTSFADDYFRQFGGWREFGNRAVREFVATHAQTDAGAPSAG